MSESRRVSKRRPMVMVIAALRIFLNRLDKARRLLDMADKDRHSARAAMLTAVGRNIPPQEKLQIEAKVGKLSSSRSGRLNDLLHEEHPDAPASSDNGSNFYPIADEQFYFVVTSYIEKIEASIWEELQEAYEGKEDRLAYASAYYLYLIQPKLEELLAESLLPSVVRAFEKYMGALARTALTVAGAKSLGDLPSVPSDIFLAYSRTDVKRWMIDQRVDTFVGGGPGEWLDDIRRWASFDPTLRSGDWSVIREAIARAKLNSRNLSNRVDSRYLADLESAEVLSDIELWSELSTSPEYLYSVADELEVAAICVGLRWVQSFFPDPEADVNYIFDRVIRFESSASWERAMMVVETMLDTCLHSDHDEFNIARINLWYCKQELKLEEEVTRRSVEGFQSKRAIEEVGRAALRRDWPSLVSALDDYKSERKSKGLGEASELGKMPLVRRAINEYAPLKSIILGPGLTRSRRRRSGRG